MVPTNTAHLLERFGLFTIILFGETLVSTLFCNPTETRRLEFYIIYSCFIYFDHIKWWQYFDNLEKKSINLKKQRSNDYLWSSIHFMSLSMIAASIRLLFLHEVNYYFILYFVFGSVLLYFLSTSFVFHQYRHKEQRLKVYHLVYF